MNLCAILTDSGVGGTFLSWTWNWLQGKNEYYHALHSRTITIVDNPLNKTNSHKFLPNQPNNIKQCKVILDNPNTQHIYFHNFRDDTTGQAIDLVRQHNYKATVVTKGLAYTLYNCTLSHRVSAVPSFNNPSQRLTDEHEILLDQLSYFFKDSFKDWQQNNSTDIWHLREFMALNCRPFEPHTIKNCHAFNFEYFELPAAIVWKQLDKHIKHWFDYYEVVIDPNRFEHWINIYHQWQELHLDRIKFCENFDNIINSVLTNQDLDFIEFNLDLAREAAIQHALIYRHNLNLKTQQLEKFKNAKQLHNLLEPNTHPLSS